MPLEEPLWWYGDALGWQSLLLSPIGLVYGAIAGVRMNRRPRYRPRLPVICIGNFTAGGTGKTPLSLALARIVREAGLAPVFLTRGYGGREAGPLLLDAHMHTALDVSDEPLLLAREAPTVVARDRVAGAKLIERQFPANAVIIMDDGLQNPSLAKDFSIAIIDARRRLGNGRSLPAGPLRARLSRQVPRVDAVLISAAGIDDKGTSDDDAGLTARLARAGYKGPILRGRVAPASEVRWLAGASVLAYAGIANPTRFFNLVRSLGGKITAERVFPDHHHFSDADAAALLAEAEKSGARLVTTEKDFVRLQGVAGSRAELRDRSLTVPITMTVDRDGEALIGALVRKLAAARAPG